MRTIKFRGKSTKWHFGDLEYSCKRDVARIHMYKSNGEYDGQVLVDPNSVGQYVGMCDKDGVEIYEGDIVEVYDFTSAYASKYIGVVTMYRGSWCVVYEDNTLDLVAHPRLFFDDFADRKTKIVGNMYDNKELLTQK